jgi:Trp operon repressor
MLKEHPTEPAVTNASTTVASNPQPDIDAPRPTDAMAHLRVSDEGDEDLLAVIPDPPAEPEDDAEDSVLRDAKIETMRRLLEFLALGCTNIEEVGWRAVVLLQTITQAQDQASLAREFGVSPATVCRKCKAMKGEIARFSGLFSRQTQIP